MNGGFAYFNDTTFTFFTSANSGLLDNNILCVALDVDDNPYMTTPAAGLVSHFGGNTFQMYFQGTVPDMPTNSFKCIERTPNGFLAGSIDEGLFIKNGVSLFTNEINWIGDEPDSYILGIHALPASFKSSQIYGYVGSQNAGLYYISPTTSTINEFYNKDNIAYTINGGVLNLKSKDKIHAITIYSIDGRILMHSLTDNSHIELPLINIPSGLITIAATTSNATYTNKLFIY